MIETEDYKKISQSIDDNTFFILMALYFKNEIYIPCLSAIYPKLSNTCKAVFEQLNIIIDAFELQVEFKKLSRAELTELNDKQESIYDSFNNVVESITQSYVDNNLVNVFEDSYVDKFSSYILDFLSLNIKLKDRTILGKFVENELKVFDDGTNRYFKEKIHLKFFKKYCDKYKDKMQDNRYKSFIYKFYKVLEEDSEDEEKYKIVKYLSFLGFRDKLILDKDSFAIQTNKKGEHQKRIAFNFPNYSAKTLFSEFEQSESIKKQKGSKDKGVFISQNTKWNLYKNAIEKKETGKLLFFEPRFISILDYCIHNQGKDITFKIYKDNIYKRKKKPPKDENINKYFLFINDEMDKAFSCGEVFVSTGRAGKWNINIDT